MTTTYQANRVRNLSKSSTNLLELERVYEENEIFRESYDQMAASLLSLRAEDEGWIPINRVGETDGFGLQSLKEVATHAELQTTGNPLLSRGLQLRRGYIWGKGVKFSPNTGKDLAPRHQAIVDKPINQSSLFSQTAQNKLERAAYTSGNLFMAYDTKEKTFFAIPFSQITNHASNPMLEEDVWYYQRTYVKTDLSTGQPEPEPTIEWYPVLETIEKKAVRKSIGENPVNQSIVIIDAKFNQAVGQVWGVPDCLSAMPYAWAHGEYVRDASKLLKALSMIAWKVVAKTKKNSVNAGARIGTVKQSGSTATMTEGTDLVSVPRAGSVDMKDGQTIASYVAAALGVSLVALLADPGSASGSYGAAASLDTPTLNMARDRQGDWEAFFRRCYRAMGVNDITVDFPRLQDEQIHRMMQSATLVRQNGGIYQDEYRAFAIEQMDIEPLHETAPPIEDFAPVSASANAYLAAEIAQSDAEDAAAAGVASQGNSGTVGGTPSNDNRDAETTAGTGA